MTQLKEFKEEKEEKYLLATDYSIPRFGFKQAALLMISLFITFTLGTMILENVSCFLILSVLLLISFGMGYSITFIQFYKRKTKKKTKRLVTLLFSLLAFILLFSFYFANTIL